MKTIIDRVTAPTPSFFKKLRNISLILTAISGAIMAAPIALPAAIVTLAGYLTVAGGIAATVAQTTKE